MRTVFVAVAAIVFSFGLFSGQASAQEAPPEAHPLNAERQTPPELGGRLSGPLVGPIEASGGGEQEVEAAQGEAAAEASVVVEILKDAERRERLISELERLIAAAGGATADGSDRPTIDSQGAEGETAEEAFSVRIVAEQTRVIVQEFMADTTRLARRIINIPYGFRGLTGDEFRVLYDALLDLAALIAVTAGAFLVLRAGAVRFYRSVSAQALQGDWWHKAGLVTASTLVDATVIIVAWGVGYAFASIFLGESGEVDIRQSLFLNAFILVELTKVVVRFFLSPSAAPLRMIAMSDRAAKVLNGWLSIVTMLIGYGQLLAAPIIAKNVTVFAGRAFSAFVFLAGLLILVALVLAHRREVAAWLLGRRRISETRRGALVALARYWHVPALVFLVGFFINVMISAGGNVLPVITASAQMLLAVLAGLIAAQALKRRIAEGVHLPERWNQRIPLLEGRLNAVLPRALFAIRILILFAVIAFIADTLALVAAREWLTSQVGARFAGGMITIALILLVVFAAWLALSSYVEFRLNPNFGSTPTAREQTLLTLLRNAITVALIVVTLMVVLSELGLDIAPLIASAGVLGLAIGIGSQKLVQDIITGIFIQLESAINVGDVITVAGVNGTVEQLTIRSVSLRDLQGTYHIIPFSSIDMVSNFNRGYAYHLLDMGISYDADVDAAKEAMVDAFESLRTADEWRFWIYGDLEWFGVETLGDSAVVLRCRIKCAPGKQWAVGRAYKEAVKRLFDQRGIDIPYPHRTVILQRAPLGVSKTETA